MKPQKYLDICCFCGKRTGYTGNGGGHTQEEMEICVIKKFIAQGILPEDYEKTYEIAKQCGELANEKKKAK